MKTRSEVLASWPDEILSFLVIVVSFLELSVELAKTSVAAKIIEIDRRLDCNLKQRNA